MNEETDTVTKPKESSKIKANDQGIQYRIRYLKSVGKWWNSKLFWNNWLALGGK